jgi:hypothetical protein
MKNNLKAYNYAFFFIIIIFIFQLYIPVVKETLSSTGSSDFQWKPATCLFNGINHYEAYLKNDLSCDRFMTQHGEYLQGFYLILYPFTLLSWTNAKLIWFLFNFILLFFFLNLITNKFRIYGLKKIIIFFFSFSAIITKIHFIMGQQAIFTLFFLTLPFINKSRLSYFFSGLCYFKYNIGFALFLYLLSTKNYKNILISMIPSILGWLAYSYLTKTSLLINAFEPFLLMIKNFKVITNDLNQVFLFTSFMNLTSNFYLNFIVIILFIFIFTLFFIIKISKINDDLTKISLLCLVILSALPHWNHDYVLIIPLFILSVRDFHKSLLHKINFFLAVYFLHLSKGIFLYFINFLNFLETSNQFINFTGNIYPYLNILALIICLMANLEIYKNKLRDG